VARLREVFAQRPRLAYLIPTFHNPTGVVMPEAPRRALARLAEETGVPIVEDHALADLALGVEPPPPIAAFARDAPIVTIGSMSKLFWGGLRVGWLRAAERLIERLARFKAVADLGSSPLSQAVAARLLPQAERMKIRRHREVTRKLDGLTTALKAQLPEWSWRRPQGGLLLWARLPRGNANEFAQVALRHGVALVPGSVNSPSNGFADYVRLPFIHETERLETGVARLAEAWREYERAARERRSELGVIV
jgi:DNA-binding transcriptional MocR family regulator